MNRWTFVGVLLACCVWSAPANAGQPAATACDRECLRGYRQDVIDERATRTAR
jgi:hypothetical protein